jgi:hypothetical protein
MRPNTTPRKANERADVNDRRMRSNGELTSYGRDGKVLAKFIGHENDVWAAGRFEQARMTDASRCKTVPAVYGLTPDLNLLAGTRGGSAGVSAALWCMVEQSLQRATC